MCVISLRVSSAKMRKGSGPSNFLFFILFLWKRGSGEGWMLYIFGDLPKSLKIVCRA